MKDQALTDVGDIEDYINDAITHLDKLQTGQFYLRDLEDGIDNAIDSLNNALTEIKNARGSIDSIEEKEENEE